MTVGVIGCGNMGQALIQGMLACRLVAPRQLVTWHPRRDHLAGVVRRFKIRAARSNREVAASPVVILAVKPRKIREILEEVRLAVSHRPLFISVAAGISTRFIEKRLGGSIPVIRVMPNTPALVGQGISAIAKGRAAGKRHLKLAEKIFRSVGEVVRVPEKWIDAITAISGSGPAYFFFLMEQMGKAAVQLGIPPAVARRLVLQTAFGAAQLAKNSDEDLKMLRARVTSKGGTTEAAFRVFARRKLDQILQEGIRAAAQRAKELSRSVK